VDTQSLAIRQSYICNAAAAIKATENDPRAANCRGFFVDAAGKVVGIHMVHVSIPSAPYALYNVTLLDEYQTDDTVCTVSVLDENGVVTAERAMMAWPFPALDAPESPVGPGNPKNEFMMSSKFPSDVIGPLAWAVYDAQGRMISDVAGGGGQVLGYGHISLHVTFRAREMTPDPDPEPEPDPEGDALARIADAIERLAAHLGA
jgi:hypothetical protein